MLGARFGCAGSRLCRREIALTVDAKYLGLVPNSTMKPPRFGFEIFVVSLAAILLEVSYTRVISFKLVYYFTYLIIGIALLGLGAGGVTVAMFPALRRTPTSRMLPACCLLGATGVLASYVVVVGLQVNAIELVQAVSALRVADALWEGTKLGILCMSMFLPFLAVGLCIAKIFSTNADRVNRLYFFDLLGAGIGCAASVPLMQFIWPPGCVILAGALLAIAGLPLAMREARWLTKPLAMIGSVMLLVSVFLPGSLPDPIVDSAKTLSPQKNWGAGLTLYSRWSPVFRVDVLKSVFDKTGSYVLAHDGMWGARLPRFDGNLAAHSYYETEMRSYPFRLSVKPPRVLIIGSAGGNEILASLYFGAEHVTGIEINPVTVSLLTDHFREFTGGLAYDERVTLINAEGRSYLMKSDEKFDVIWFVTPDSYAAMNAASSGAYVLSESYLYTVEMLRVAIQHLSSDGTIVTQFGGEVNFDVAPTRTPRYLATAREAFRAFGVDDFSRHVLVSSAPGYPFTAASIILKRSPVTEADIVRFTNATKAIKGARVRYTWQEADGDDPISKVIRLGPEALGGWYAGYPYEVRPATDDAPFFWHFTRFRTALAKTFVSGPLVYESGIGERLFVVLLVFAIMMAAVFLLTPLLAQRSLWREIPHKGSAAIYFASLGMGFMLLEVSLIQRLTLFLGYPTYSLTVTIFALLVSTAAGSLVSERLRLERRSLAILAACLVVLVAFYTVGLTPMVDALVGIALPIRVAVTVMVLAPLGLCLGVFMPLGLRTVAGLTEHDQEYVAWAWAINGFFSVISSLLATILSMVVGFSAVMLIALVIYLIGISALDRLPITPAPAR